VGAGGAGLPGHSRPRGRLVVKPAGMTNGELITFAAALHDMDPGEFISATMVTTTKAGGVGVMSTITARNEMVGILAAGIIRVAQPGGSDHG
jgi:hypothetical protein